MIWIHRGWLKVAVLLAAAGMALALLAPPHASAHVEPRQQLADATTAIRACPNDANLYMRRGELFRQMHRWSDALADYDWAAALDPSLSTVEAARALAHLGAKQPDAALLAIDRFLAQQPNDGIGLLTRARVLNALGRFSEASDGYACAIPRLKTVAPEHVLEHAACLASLGRTFLDQALSALDSGMARLGPIASLQLQAIDLDIRLGRIESALLRLANIENAAQRKELWLARRGRILESVGRWNDARAAFLESQQALLALSPHLRYNAATMSLGNEVAASLARLGLGSPPMGTTNSAHLDDSNRQRTQTVSHRDGSIIDNADARSVNWSMSPIVFEGSIWRFLDNGTDQGTAWRTNAFIDSTWSAGAAELGYGDGDEQTVVSYGPNASNKYITTYFRRRFHVDDPAFFDGPLNLRVVRDDGVVVYLNGNEVYRNNMPSGGGAINSLTLASSAISGADESTFQVATLDPALLQSGENVLAVEIHQSAANSSDISFNLSLQRSNATTLPAAVTTGSTWKFLDDGTNQGTAWRSSAFNDGAWASGAQLGYGDGDESTVVSYGPNASNKYITTYFRRTFQVTDPAIVAGPTVLRVLHDDGAVVYLNGNEVFRANMPAGAIDYLTLASSSTSGINETLFTSMMLSPSALQLGTNVLAVEIHQNDPTSSDISFDLDLLVPGGETQVTRGPYLQRVTPSSAVVRWRTLFNADSAVRYGTAIGQLNQSVSNVALGTEHELTITGLQPDTRYYFSVGTSAGPVEGDDAYHQFRTLPAFGAAKPARIWALGDSGTASAAAADVRDGYMAYANGQAPDVWLMLGDNAYTEGTDGQYQAAVFDMYESMLHKTALWPTLGNHDALSANSPTQSGVYYDIFTLPTQGQSGGLASGTEAYYSFDYGDIHFICLDSEDSDRSPTGAMMTWLAADVASTAARWVIAYWHHPPYTKGSHDSDNDSDSGGRMRDMREVALPILEAAGVDLVLTGHSHAYERSFLLDGHYDTSLTLTPQMILDGGNGNETGDGAYMKPHVGQAPHEGAVYIVAGSSGQTGGGPLNHPAMFVSLNQLGSLVIDIDAHRLDARFLNAVSATLDIFTMLKPPIVPGDITGDGVVNIDDLLAVINAWGACGNCAGCPADVNHDCAVNIDDLLFVISNWSP